MDQPERIEIYQPPPPQDSPLERFKAESGNSAFRKSRMTIISLVFLLILYPMMTLGFGDDPTEMLKSLNEGTRTILLVSTIVMQWCLFLMIYVTIFREGTMFGGLGFKKIRGVDFAWGVAFLMAANLILSGLAWSLAQVGLEMPGEIGLLIPTDWGGRALWVVVSITAGICEETAFRGYLMTRIRILGKFQNWVVPTLVSALVFGALHSYQGMAGMIVISTYGVLFSLLYIRTGRIWPGIIAHFLQDFGALFYPH